MVLSKSSPLSFLVRGFFLYYFTLESGCDKDTKMQYVFDCDGKNSQSWNWLHENWDPPAHV